MLHGMSDLAEWYYICCNHRYECYTSQNAQQLQYTVQPQLPVAVTCSLSWHWASPGRHTWVTISSSSLLSSKYLCYFFHFYSPCRVQQCIHSLPSLVLVQPTPETSHSIISTTCWSPQLLVAVQGKQRPPSSPLCVEMQSAALQEL